jgi:uncharacterized protein GlcG (DUF336 family)
MAVLKAAYYSQISSAPTAVPRRRRQIPDGNAIIHRGDAMPRHEESLCLIVIATGGLPVPHGKTFIGAGAAGSTVDQDEKVVEATRRVSAHGVNSAPRPAGH